MVADSFLPYHNRTGKTGILGQVGILGHRLTTAWNVGHIGGTPHLQAMTTETQANHAEANANGHAQTIEALYELSCWDFRTGELPQALTGAAADLLSDIGWDAETGTPDSLQEAVTQYAQEMPLSVTVRSDWHFPGESDEPAEFQIQMSWGGPSCRIIGVLDRGSVAWQSGCRPVMQHQDWFKPWTEISYDINTDALLWFCEQFYYGE